MNSPETSPILSPTLRDALAKFLKYHPARRVNKNLRNMFIEYLQNADGKDFQDIQSILFDLEGLFNFLDVVEIEWREVVE